MLEQCLARPVPDIPATFLYSDSETEYGRPARRQHELFIPAPAHLSREDAFNYHLTTRNFFAWMFERPLVGPRLGDALIDLKERMDQYRPDREENEDDFLIYIDAQGYSDFRDCPDHSLAVLQYAEKFHYAELWTDAFCHCAGMNELLISSSEFSVCQAVFGIGLQAINQY